MVKIISSTVKHLGLPGVAELSLSIGDGREQKVGRWKSLMGDSIDDLQCGMTVVAAPELRLNPVLSSTYSTVHTHDTVHLIPTYIHSSTTTIPHALALPDIRN
jgi:hypothetical protein